MKKEINLEKVFIWIFVFIFFIFPIVQPILEESEISLNPNDWARITEMEYSAIVVDEPGSEGKIVVTERITFDIHAASRDNGFWELWRDLCEDYVDGVRVHYKVNSVKQIFPDGSEQVWEESSKLYWDDYDYVSSNPYYGPGKWYHSEGPYNEYSRDYECVFFYIDDVYRDTMVFEIEYEMYNAVLRYNDCSDLYIAMYSGDTAKYLEYFKGEILIPNKDMPQDGNYTVTTYGTSANGFPVKESATANPGYYTFSFELDENDLKFPPYNDYIEFDLVSYGEDKHVFAENASTNYYTGDDVLEEIYAEQEEYVQAPAKYKGIKATVLVVCLALAIVVFIKVKKKIDYYKNRCPNYSPNPHNNKYRDVPSDLDPKFAKDLVFCKDKKEHDDEGAYSAVLLSLIRKGYINLHEMSHGDVMLEIEYIDTPEEIAEANMYESLESYDNLNPFEQYDPRAKLTTCERLYLELVKRHAVNNQISMTELQRRISNDFAYMSSFESRFNGSVVNYGVGLQYFQKADYLEPKRVLSSLANKLFWCGLVFTIASNLISYHTRLDLAFGGFLILGLTILGCGIYLKKNAHKYVLLAKTGEEEYNKWRGLYNFLNSDTLIKDRTVIELPLWEKYLVYATAFGISEKVIQAIKIRCPEMESRSIVHSSYCRSGRIHHHSRSFHSSVRSGSRGFSSGGFGGGGGGFGYGGGGRGGGGGGGGH